MNTRNVVLSFLKEGTEKHAMDFSSINPMLVPENPLSDKELIRTIRLALAAEEDAVHLYDLIEDSTENKIVKDIVKDIRDEEKVHVGELQKILAMLDKNEEGFLEEGAKEVEEKTGK
jgi:rubrerythrin